jgi:glycerol-3-phosphate O-acyltransferase/dihydroxyacetone phosphate acyltransferase
LKLIYYITKILVYVFQRVFYRFDHIGREHVPCDQPVIFAPNHVNAFMDPMLIGMTVKQEVRFFARGDVFKGAFAKWILDQLNISPVYRIQEGYSELRKNDKTFEECRQLLTANKSILMFPEGICIQERRLRPLKKGLARIAFQTASSMDFRKDVLVVPVGINYSSAKHFRSKAVVHFGKPISIGEYKDLYNTDNTKAINEFTKVLEEKMKPQLVIIKNPENERLVETIEAMHMAEWIHGKSANPSDLKEQYKASQAIAEMINHLDLSHPQLISSLRIQAASYMKKLKAQDLRDHLLDEKHIAKMNLGTFLLESIIIYLGMPIYGVALLLNYPPYYLAKRYCDNTIKNVEFYASIYSNMAMLQWLVYYGIQLLVVGLISHNWIILGLYAVLVPVLGYFAIGFYPVKQKIFGRWRLLRLVRKDQKSISELIGERRQFLQELGVAKKILND